MIPDSLTITAFIALPAHISFTFFIASFFIALEHTKFTLPRGYLPAGVPVPIGPFLFVIEFLSYFIRLFSLAIRLFINMLSGHMLLKIFAVIFLFIFNFGYELLSTQIFMTFVEVTLTLLEYVACMLQAAVLVSLVAIYLDHAQNFYHH
jgi:F0F1-type ATP synthase membrane subunit a